MAQNPEDRKPEDQTTRRTPPRRADDGEPFDPRGGRDDYDYRNRDYRGRDRARGGTESGGMKQLVMMALVALVVVVAANLVYFSPAKSTDVNTQLSSIAKDIQSSKTADTALQSAVTTLTNQVSGMTNTNASTTQSVAAQNSKIDQLTAQANGLTQQLATANANIANANKGVSADALQKAIDADKTARDAIQKQIDDINKKLTANTVPGATAGTTVPGVTTGGGNFYSANGVSGANSGTSNTLQGVTATITNLYGGFNGIPLLSFSVPAPNGGSVTTLTVSNGGSGYSSNVSAMPVSLMGLNGGGSGAIAQVATTSLGTIAVGSYGAIQGGYGYTNGGVVTIVGGGGLNASGTVTASALTPGSASQTITMTVTNAPTNPIINNLQLALGLAVVDSNGNPVTTLPTWITPGQNISVTSSGFGTAWTFQSVTAPNIWLFSNMASNNPFGMGAISLQPGQTQTFTQYINVTNSIGGQAGSIYLYPIIRVLSFTG